MTLPLYHSASKNPPKPGERNSKGGHAGLWFDKFCSNWVVDAQQVWSMTSSSGNNPKLQWIQTLTRNKIGIEKDLDEYALRVVNLVEKRARAGRWGVFATESRFVTGLGRSHPIENGFAWHPTLGTPFIPGSSIKGMIRAWAKAETEDADAIDKLFGKRDDVGKLCILDAVPIQPVQLEADVITPHYAGWTPEDPPGDWRSPTPIPFLVTAAETPFIFGIVPRGELSQADTDLEAAWSWLEAALEWAGAGAKTAVGYGRFAPSDECQKQIQQKRAEADNRIQERIRRELKEKERLEKLASLSPLEREIEDVFDNRQDSGMPKTTVIYMAIESGRWSGDDKKAAVCWLEEELKSEGSWKEITNAKNPKRDRNYNRTQQIMRWLDGE